MVGQVYALPDCVKDRVQGKQSWRYLTINAILKSDHRFCLMDGERKKGKENIANYGNLVPAAISMPKGMVRVFLFV